MDCLAEAHTFYTDLLRDDVFSPFKIAWLEALGNVSRYQIVALAMLAQGGGCAAPRAQGRRLSEEIALWRSTAEYWYSKALEDDPGNGKLQHHLGLLFRDAENGVLRSLYYFATR